MSQYEIMILVNPQTTDEEFKGILFSVLDEKATKVEKLERTELAYPINKLKRASYYLVNAKIAPEAIAELTRKLNIDKRVLRNLIINLDSEKGLNVVKKPRRTFNKRPFVKRDNTQRSEGPRSERAPKPRKLEKAE
ncbi:30S ribosomal protein S6 [[Mycoplasma] falconis]|uniref:Small ribosomal subunit protein bS6 n=1 Tax=[Mycoplasma] falconis TaxID=92403 RepID=A0A501X9H7_9BACT|nr:30S ribosomal protein S6 [[Mycoplasma] falconis]TPE57201.1 30S ribosomal protein S6 [[Mycoplasma] falconis]